MHFDTVIIGAGTAGCVLANRLSAVPDHRVALVEAGPDFGPLADGAWPAQIAGATFIEEDTGFDWGYQAEISGAPRRYLRGRIVGGSSATNATGINWGLRRDYDEWEALGNPG